MGVSRDTPDHEGPHRRSGRSRACRSPALSPIPSPGKRGPCLLPFPASGECAGGPARFCANSGHRRNRRGWPITSVRRSVGLAHRRGAHLRRWGFIWKKTSSCLPCPLVHRAPGTLLRFLFRDAFFSWNFSICPALRFACPYSRVCRRVHGASPVPPLAIQGLQSTRATPLLRP